MAHQQGLKVWSLGPDWVVAMSAEDAVKVIEEHMGEPATDHDIYVDDARQLEDDETLAIIYDWPLDDPHTIPQKATWARPSKWQITFTATAAEWAKSHGRGFLCSTEY